LKTQSKLLTHTKPLTTNITDTITNKQFDSLDFPYYSYFTNINQIKLDFEKLKLFKPIIRTNDNNKALESLTINGKRFKNYIIVENYKSYYLLHKITDYFSQRCRVLCEFRYPDGLGSMNYKHFKNIRMTYIRMFLKITMLII
jgi:hypothetical protein